MMCLLRVIDLEGADMMGYSVFCGCDLIRHMDPGGVVISYGSAICLLVNLGK
jgi:hypothetical protein